MITAKVLHPYFNFEQGALKKKLYLDFENEYTIFIKKSKENFNSKYAI